MFDEHCLKLYHYSFSIISEYRLRIAYRVISHWQDPVSLEDEYLIKTCVFVFGRKRNAKEKTGTEEETGTEAENQLDTEHSTVNETNTGLVAYMTTISDEAQDGGDSNADEEHTYHHIPTEADTCLYMEVEGQEDIQFAPDARHDTKTEIQTSADSYTALILEEIEPNRENVPHLYTQLKQDKFSAGQEEAAMNTESNTDAHNPVYTNSKVVENMKRMKRP